jgi:hypothetical protein
MDTICKIKFVMSVLVGIIACTMLCSCNIASTVAYVTAPNPVTEAEYELKDTSTVIFIDDRRNWVSPVRLRRIIGDTASEGLLKEEIVTDVISPRDATAAARQLDRGPRPIGIDRVGEMVGAKQVIYVEMVGFSLSQDGLSPEPYAACRVRVIDLDEQKRLYPPVDESNSRLVEVSLPGTKSQGMTDSRQRQKLGELLAMETGKQVAMLFYEHSQPAVGANLLFGER